MDPITTYIELLKQYNTHTNIYSKTAYDRLSFHCADAQALAQLIGNTKKTVLDMGSGSGLPAIILAITNPKNTVLAVESKSRKTRFLDSVKTTLNLTNLQVLNQPIQTVSGYRVDVVTAKAFKPASTIVQLAKRLRARRCLVPISANQRDTLPPELANCVTTVPDPAGIDWDAFYYVDYRF